MITFSSFDGFLTTLAVQPWSPQLRDAIMEYTRDTTVSRQFAEAINDGLELNPDIVEGISFHSVFPENMRAELFGVGAARFDDDARFTSTRFAVTTSGWQYLAPLGGDSIPNAAAQLARMFAAGRVIPDLGYLVDFKRHVDRSTNQFAYLQIPIHFMGYQQILLRDAELPGANSQDVADAAMLRQMVDESFLTHWLPSAIGEAEAAEAARTMSMSLLYELYSPVWDEGYDGHYDRMQAKITA